MQFNYDEYYPVLKKDPKLRALIQKVGPCTVDKISGINMF
jgi:hypothetical protein